MMFNRYLIVLVFLGGAVITGPSFVLASSDAETVIGECQKRTGMGRESCISFVKKYMNVERCQQYTKLSAENCQKKLEEIRNSPEFRNDGSRAPSPPETVPKTNMEASPQIRLPEGAQTLVERIRGVRQEKAARFQLIEEDLERLLRFLREKKIDVSHLENRLVIFREKRDVVLKAYDQYASVASSPVDTRPPLSEPRRIVTQLMDDVAAYYRSDLLPAFKDTVDKVQE